MSDGIIQQINTCVEQCLHLCNNNNTDQLDFVISSMERLIVSISLEDSERDIPWATDVIQQLEDIVEISERVMAQLSSTSKRKIKIPKNSLVDLLELKFSATTIAKMFGVSRMTIYRRFSEYNISVRVFVKF
jgi:predicted transcriptional regulator YheO